MGLKSNIVKWKIERAKAKAVKNHLYSLFFSRFIDKQFSSMTDGSQMEEYYNLVKKMDRNCKILLNEGMRLDELSEKNKVFIHRTYLDINPIVSGIPKNEDLYNILTKGLKNYGHMNATGGSAFTTYVSPLSLTMSSLNTLAGYKDLFTPYHGGGVNENNVIIVAAFPDFLVTDDGRPVTGNFNDIYDLSGDVPCIKPDFMKGALVKKNTGYWVYYSKEEIKLSYDTKRKN